MLCEICGIKILGQTFKAKIEEANLIVCKKCSKHGKILPQIATSKQSKPLFLKSQSKQKFRREVKELVENFALKIRQARERKGISHEKLGRKLNEKVSVLKKIEIGKMKPNNKLAEKIERTLKIEILIPSTEGSQRKIPTPVNSPVTFGDLIQLTKKKMEEQP